VRVPLLDPLRLLLGAVAPPLCAACGGTAGVAEPLCLGCRRGLRWLDVAWLDVGGVPTWAPVAYDGAARALVGALKFRGASGAAAVMAAQIAARLPRATRGTDPEVALVPVPIHPRRLRRRGYNQAALLAHAIAERTGLAVADCLERTGAPGAQVGRDRAARLGGPPGVVRLRPGVPAPTRALLVDDVVTTGGTLSACAHALRNSGTEGVRALAYARTPGR
jgi:predicted amidophosphoribosyltransferase